MGARTLLDVLLNTKLLMAIYNYVWIKTAETSRDSACCALKVKTSLYTIHISIYLRFEMILRMKTSIKPRK